MSRETQMLAKERGYSYITYTNLIVGDQVVSECKVANDATSPGYSGMGCGINMKQAMEKASQSVNMSLASDAAFGKHDLGFFPNTSRVSLPKNDPGFFPKRPIVTESPKKVNNKQWGNSSLYPKSKDIENRIKRQERFGPVLRLDNLRTDDVIDPLPPRPYIVKKSQKYMKEKERLDKELDDYRREESQNSEKLDKELDDYNQKEELNNYLCWPVVPENIEWRASVSKYVCDPYLIISPYYIVKFSGLHPRTSVRDLKDLCKGKSELSYNDINVKIIDGKDGKCAYIKVNQKDKADEFVKLYNNRQLDGNTLTVESFSKDCHDTKPKSAHCIVKFSNLADRVTTQHIKDLCSMHKDVQNVKIIDTKDGKCAYVKVTSNRTAKILVSLDGTILCDRILTVECL